MIVTRLPIKPQRPTFNAHRSTLELPNVSPSKRSRAGFTMIELVVALALFVVIFGILLLALNTATDLWHNSRAQRRELPSAEHIADLIADDLYQAVADVGPLTNSSETLFPTFFMRNVPTNAPAGTPYVVLAFPRSASPRTRDIGTDSQETRLALDAVFYTVFSNALYRLTFPIHTETDRSKSLGELFESGIAVAEASIRYTESPPSFSVTRLADHAIPTFLVHFPSESFGETLTTNALPDMVDVSVHLFNNEDWSAFQPIWNDTSDAAVLTRAHLGTLISRRITLPQAGGSRLP